MSVIVAAIRPRATLLGEAPVVVGARVRSGM
jgi:hypothetical protein